MTCESCSCPTHTSASICRAARASAAAAEATIFFQNFERALEPARTGEVDVVVHGGDLLFRSRVPARLAEAALAPLKQLADSGTPVLLVAGNHERSCMPFPLLALHERLHIFDRTRTVFVDARGVRVAFMGFPYTHACAVGPPLVRIPAASVTDDGHAHGFVRRCRRQDDLPAHGRCDRIDSR